MKTLNRSVVITSSLAIIAVVVALNTYHAVELDFTTPALEDGHRVAHGRISFWEPSFLGELRTPSVHTGVMILVLMMLPISYFWRRREVRPLDGIAVRRATGQDGSDLQIEPGDPSSEEFRARKTQSEFLAHMVHELKEPLNVMSMYTESLLDSDAADESFRVDACNVIRDQIDRLNGLINHIFSIDRIESGALFLNRQPIRIRELLEDIFASVSRDDRHQSIRFELTLPGALPPIFADEQLLSVALENLLTNAIKYNRPGGKVALEVDACEIGLLITVADSGIGIDESEFERIFEKFYRSEDENVRKVGGHGLGLALVEQIVTLHGGELRLSSRLGAGSEFSIFFDRKSSIFRDGSPSIDRTRSRERRR